MRKFFRDVSFTLLLIALADYLYGAFVKNNYSEKNAYIIHHSDDIKTLVMGNSLSETGFNTMVLGDDAWCFAISGRALYFDEELLKRHLPVMKNLQNVVLTLHYNLYTDVLLDSAFVTSQGYHIYNNFRFLHVPVNSFPKGWLYRSALLSGQMHKKNNVGATIDKFGNILIDSYFDGVKRDDHPPHQQNLDKAIEYLTSMARICAEHRVRFIVVTPPFPNTWLEECTQQSVSNLYMITDSVNQMFPIEYGNYMDDSMFRDDSLYCNWSHLNRFGATLFAQRVKEDFGL